MLPTDAEMHNTNTEGKFSFSSSNTLHQGTFQDIWRVPVVFFLIQHHTIAAHKAVEAQYIAVILN